MVLLSIPLYFHDKCVILLLVLCSIEFYFRADTSAMNQLCLWHVTLIYRNEIGYSPKINMKKKISRRSASN